MYDALSHLSSTVYRTLRGAAVGVFLLTPIVPCLGQATESVEVTASSVELVVPRHEVKAGDLFEFTIKLDRAPNFSGGSVQYVITGPEHVRAVNNCTPFSGYLLSYTCDFRVPAVGPAGKWRIKSAYFNIGNKKIKLIDKPADFRVLPNPGIILPTRAELFINDSQTELLEREAASLSNRIQLLKSGIKYYQNAPNKGELTPLLSENLNSAAIALSKTQAEFIKLTPTQEQVANAEVFFRDLKTGYEDAFHLMKSTSSHAGIFLMPVSDDQKYWGADPLVVAAVALRPLEENELAYNVVASAGSLTFDLEVESAPPGAVVSYHRRGDAPHANPNPTNSTIHSLPYAIWVIKFEKAGYKPVEREHDPFREFNHVVHVELDH
jgi:hypothetical protein